MDIEDYEHEKAEKKLLMKLHEAEEAVKDEGAWMSLEELKASVGVQHMKKLRINPIVAEDLESIKEYIAEDNEEMAVKTIQEIYTRIEDIQQFPYMGADMTVQAVRSLFLFVTFTQRKFAYRQIVRNYAKTGVKTGNAKLLKMLPKEGHLLYNKLNYGVLCSGGTERIVNTEWQIFKLLSDSVKILEREMRL